MKSLPGYTVSELMKESGKSRSAVESWISRHKVKPVSYEARYPEEILVELKKTTRGRPKKPGTPQQAPES